MIKTLTVISFLSLTPLAHATESNTILNCSLGKDAQKTEYTLSKSTQNEDAYTITKLVPEKYDSTPASVELRILGNPNPQIDPPQPH